MNTEELGDLKLTAADEATDYFPSYEIITRPVFGGRFYGENRRSVRPEGVAHVMENFFHDLDTAFGRTPVRHEPPKAGPMAKSPDEEADEAEGDIRCEEEMLAAFGARATAGGQGG